LLDEQVATELREAYNADNQTSIAGNVVDRYKCTVIGDGQTYPRC